MIENRLMKAVEKTVFTKRAVLALGTAALVTTVLRATGGRRKSNDVNTAAWKYIDVAEYAED